MARLTPLITGKLIAFDTAPLIYYIEENPVYLPLVDELFDALDSDDARGMTSVLTLQEVLVKPLRDGRHDLADKYRQILTASVNITLHVIDEATCETAAQIRAKYAWLRTPDALQVATALNHSAQIMVTNDVRWQHLTEIKLPFCSTSSILNFQRTLHSQLSTLNFSPTTDNRQPRTYNRSRANVYGLLPPNIAFHKIVSTITEKVLQFNCHA